MQRSFLLSVLYQQPRYFLLFQTDFAHHFTFHYGRLCSRYFFNKVSVNYHRVTIIHRWEKNLNAINETLRVQKSWADMNNQHEESILLFTVWGQSGIGNGERKIGSGIYRSNLHNHVPLKRLFTWWCMIWWSMICFTFHALLNKL